MDEATSLDGRFLVVFFTGAGIRLTGAPPRAEDPSRHRRGPSELILGIVCRKSFRFIICLATRRSVS
ncbi:hypothetical protein PC111_g6821 [Phytophthora cactorum]|nr:hypothetical protein PC111_g6821 [Phytophthora cactorum]KAG3090418.1 hypothetical protein PC122_g7457 [Phytophthora cactorum]